MYQLCIHAGYIRWCEYSRHPSGHGQCHCRRVGRVVITAAADQSFIKPLTTMFYLRPLRTLSGPLRPQRYTRLQFSTSPTATTHEVVVDNQTIYITREIAEALGWKPNQGFEGVQLTLHGWEPSFFTITPTGSDSEMLSKRTVESSRNQNVQTVLAYLKDR
ncbi:hypothetical protein B0H19DRAFT_412783 [Mycena capillaripes]|nr:hypothetical protein B0H19DRAFT_412783 [Mycena capillaripes]